MKMFSMYKKARPKPLEIPVTNASVVGYFQEVRMVLENEIVRSTFQEYGTSKRFVLIIFYVYACEIGNIIIISRKYSFIFTL